MKYKVGDKVRIVNVTDHRKDYIGRVVTIDEINPNGHTIYKPTITHYGMSESHYVFWEDELELAKIEFPKIVITTDGTETLARLYEGGKVVKSATAKCSPEDSFDALIGAKIAFDRLLGRPLAEEPKEQKWRVVKRNPRAGDYIRLVRKSFDFNKVGDILKVSEGCNGGVFVKQKDHPVREENSKVSPNYKWCYLPCHFEVIEPVGTPEMPEEPKFFSGKVVCVEAGKQYAYTVGKIYEFKDGKVINDNNITSSIAAVRNLDEWHRHCSYAKFIPLVESEGTK